MTNSPYRHVSDNKLPTEDEQLLESPPPVRLYGPGSWGPKSIHQLVAPQAWRLPFERAWRDPNKHGA